MTLLGKQLGCLPGLQGGDFASLNLDKQHRRACFAPPVTSSKRCCGPYSYAMSLFFSGNVCIYRSCKGPEIVQLGLAEVIKSMISGYWQGIDELVLPHT